MPKNNYTVERVKPNGENMMKNSLFAQTVRTNKLNLDTLKWKLILRRRAAEKLAGGHGQGHVNGKLRGNHKHI